MYVEENKEKQLSVVPATQNNATYLPLEKDGEEGYIIEQSKNNELGQGQQAIVYKIIRKRDGIECAGKFFKIQIESMDKYELIDVERELSILQKAVHPFLGQYIENFVYKKMYKCIVTKYYSGGNLSKILRGDEIIKES